ncbi:DUF3833 family protein [Acidithiobacillus montserratensis]|uniref:DUF3833 family protein n=1 Tax=Acidithiobacillus montserratensis TaxID=2729135 RepID=A0ACD5HGK2_9PROT|nr:DUF3833 family protein [Acidithiobacillus montserratensis]MBN2679429.1 DUF3833 family protein [Acidithiobacillaceae bacterium]MBU2747188.1 DUF3833 domain-containing protein [Acidithiobacillus montserratensis]
MKKYASTLPLFQLHHFFNGPSVATGIFQDRSGKVVNRFIMHLLGTWQSESVGSLSEKFLFLDNDGKATHAERVWQLQVTGEHTFAATAQGSAGDIVGVAQGEAEGFAMRWRYTLRQPVGKRFFHLRVDDWMYLIDKDHVINRSKMRFWGFFVGDVSIEIHRLADTPENRESMIQLPRLGDPVPV